MLTRVDRIQMVVADRTAAAASFFRLLGAERSHEDSLRALGARRTVLRLGASEVELLEPDGAGLAADFVRASGGGLFAAGVASHDLAGVRSRLRAQSVECVDEGGQLLVPASSPGLRLVVSDERTHAPVGLARHLYEVTNLVPAFASATKRLAIVFDLDDRNFVSIRSAEFGYEGTLTLFHPDRLDRIEVITPGDPTKTMGRYFAKRGPSLYMCYVEADDVDGIRNHLMEHAPHDWTGPRDGRIDNLWIHPKALAGVMVGVSRTTVGWTWSGHPERVRPEA